MYRAELQNEGGGRKTGQPFYLSAECGCSTVPSAQRQSSRSPYACKEETIVVLHVWTQACMGKAPLIKADQLEMGDWDVSACVDKPSGEKVGLDWWRLEAAVYTHFLHTAWVELGVYDRNTCIYLQAQEKRKIWFEFQRGSKYLRSTGLKDKSETRWRTDLVAVASWILMMLIPNVKQPPTLSRWGVVRFPDFVRLCLGPDTVLLKCRLSFILSKRCVCTMLFSRSHLQVYLIPLALAEQITALSEWACLFCVPAK